MKKNKRLKWVIIILAICLVAAGYGVFYFYSKAQDNALQSESLQSQISMNTQTVYVAITDIYKGAVITDEGPDANVQIQNIFTGLESSNYLQAEDLGAVAIVNLTSGDPVMKNMVTTETLANDTRWYEINVAELMTTQEENDCVDVRIAFPDGEDFIVLSKKHVKDLKRDSCIFNTKLNEEEIIRFRSAIIDAYMIGGCVIYTTKYVEENLQEEAVPTYPVNEANIALIGSDPNILTRAEETLNIRARVALETRLADYEDEYLTVLQSSYDNDAEKKNSIWQEEKNNDVYAEEDDVYETVGDQGASDAADEGKE